MGLYRYIDFTAKLEDIVGNRTVLAITHNATGVRIPEEMRFDAGHYGLSTDAVEEVVANVYDPDAVAAYARTPRARPCSTLAEWGPWKTRARRPRSGRQACSRPRLPFDEQ